MFPFDGSVIRYSASLTGSCGRQFASFPGTTRVLRLPTAPPTSLPFVREAVPRTAARPHEAAGSCCSRPSSRYERRCLSPLPSTHARLTASAPRAVTFRGSITQPVRSLSTLHGSDCSVHTAQDSLPLTATLNGTDSHLLGCVRRSPHCVFNSHRFPSSKLFLAHQPA